MSKNELVPVGNLPGMHEFDPEVHSASWDFSLPPTIDEDRIVLDGTALARLQKIGAIRSSHVLDYQGGVTQYDIGVSDINPDGSALATKSKVAKQADKSESAIRDDLHGGYAAVVMNDYFKTRTIHRLNKDELSSVVVDYRQEHKVTREEAWAKVLNVTLRESFDKTAYEHLIRRKAKPWRGIDTALIGLNAYSLAENTLAHDASGVALTASVLGGCYGLVVAGSALGNKHEFGETLLSERRWSLNPWGGWQPDRYLAIKGLSRMTPVIRYLK